MFNNEMNEKNTREEWKGFFVHSIVTVLVCILLLAINFAFTPQFLWFVFPWTGMSIGVAVHFFIGFRGTREI